MTDLSSVCLTCMTSGITMMSVENFGLGKITYSVKLRTCLPIINSKHYNFNDGFLCEKCASLVEDYFEFYQKCVQTKWNLEKAIIENTKRNGSKPPIVVKKLKNDPDAINITPSSSDYDKKSINEDKICNVNGDKKIINVNKFFIIGHKNDNNAIENKENNNQRKRIIILSKNRNIRYKNIVNVTKNCNNENNTVKTETNEDDIKVENIVNETTEINDNIKIENVICKIEDTNNMDVDTSTPEEVMIKIEAEETFNEIEDNKLQDPLLLDIKSNDVNVLKNNYENDVVNDMEIDIIKNEIKLEECEDTAELHQCDFCKTMFEQSKDLQVHLKTIHPLEITNTCPICSESYPKKRSYYTHIFKNHSDLFRFICEPCQIPFQTETELMEHKDFKMCYFKDHFSCNQCALKFSREILLTHHIKSMHNTEKKFSCTLCDTKFFTNYRLAYHMKIRHSHQQSLTCKICKKTFSKPSLLRLHNKKHANSSNYICGCGKKYENINDLSNHQQTQNHTTQQEFENYKKIIKMTKNEKIPKNFQCDKCGEIFTVSWKFQKHIQKHSETIYPCKYCSMKFKCVSNRNAHIRRVHQKDTQYMCHICAKRLLTPSLLEEHLNVHKGIKKHLCHFCGELFLLKSTMLRHRKRHTGDYKKFPCTHCDKILKSNNDLINHIRTHTGEKPFSCEHCGKCFAVKRQVIVHINSAHLEQKPYVCEICNQGCPTFNSLKIHKTKHTNARPFSCQICLASYKTKNKLNRHLIVSSCREKWKGKNNATNFGNNEVIVSNKDANVQ